MDEEPRPNRDGQSAPAAGGKTPPAAGGKTRASEAEAAAPADSTLSRGVAAARRKLQATEKRRTALKAKLLVLSREAEENRRRALGIFWNACRPMTASVDLLAATITSYFWKSLDDKRERVQSGCRADSKEPKTPCGDWQDKRQLIGACRTPNRAKQRKYRGRSSAIEQNRRVYCSCCEPNNAAQSSSENRSIGWHLACPDSHSFSLLGRRQNGFYDVRIFFGHRCFLIGCFFSPSWPTLNADREAR